MDCNQHLGEIKQGVNNKNDQDTLYQWKKYSKINESIMK